MRRWFVTIGLLFAQVGDGRAQAPAEPIVPPPVTSPVPDIIPPQPATTPLPAPTEFLIPATSPAEPQSVVDFIFGVPTGFRFQRAMAQDRIWHFEGFVGLEVVFPIAGVGVRRRYAPICGQTDALVVAPGVDGYVLFNVYHNSNGFWIGGGGPALGWMVAGDVDLMWRHAFSTCQSQLGVKLGLGVAYGARAAIVPVTGVFGGICW
jgi:hypothetical protein